MNPNPLDKLVEQFAGRLDHIDLAPYRGDDYTPRVKPSSEYLAALKARLQQCAIFGDGTGFATCDDHFRFRPFELTIWTGYKGHGKSTLLSQVLLGFLQQHKKLFVCSPEFHPVELLYRFLVQTIASSLPTEKDADRLIALTRDLLWLYDVQSSLKPHDVPALCRWVCEKLQPDHIIIDSLMKCGLAPDDYAGQKKLVDQVQSVAHQHNVHIHLVAHARKTLSDDKPARLHDIKGASEIADLAENVISVWRNKPKEQERSQGNMSKVLEPDALLIVEAQRNCGGWIGTVLLNYQPATMLFYENGMLPNSYVSMAVPEIAF